MTTIYANHLFTVSAEFNRELQLERATVKMHQKDISVSSGYVGDNTEQDRAIDCSERWENRAVVVKYWANQEKTVLKAVAIFSKHAVPYNVTITVTIKNTPPINEAVNQKYLLELKGPESVDRIYTLLQENPNEFPIIPVARVLEALGRTISLVSQDDLVDLRSEVDIRKRHQSCWNDPT